jgi:hypothetical protein
VELTRHTLIAFCKEFVARPYLCYTEHGLHALFFSRLYNAFPAENRYAECNGQQVCVVQKEYPTAHNLGKSRRQHWDISVIKAPVVPAKRPNAFDYLPLAAVVEFGLNCPSDHLEDDIMRLCHPEANVDHRFVVHLYRLSPIANKVSGRDWAPESNILCSKDSVKLALRDRPVEVFYGVVDSSGTTPPGIWLITGRGIEVVAKLVPTPAHKPRRTSQGSGAAGKECFPHEAGGHR